MKKRILILGSKGYLGSNFTNAVISNDKIVVEIFDKKFSYNDLLNYEVEIRKILSNFKPDLVFNFIAAGVHNSRANINSLSEANTKFPIFLMNILEKYEVKRTIFFGTYLEDKNFKNDHELPNYVQTKVDLLDFLRKSNSASKILYLRLPNIFGGLNQHPNCLLQSVKKYGSDLTIRNPNRIRNFLGISALMNFLTSDGFLKYTSEMDSFNVLTILSSDFMRINNFVNIALSNNFLGKASKPKKGLPFSSWETELVILNQNIEMILKSEKSLDF